MITEGMNSKLNPYYISGLVDGEGCFCVTFNKHGNNRVEVRLLFEIELREDDFEILNRVLIVLNNNLGNLHALSPGRFKIRWHKRLTGINHNYNRN